MSQQFQFSSPTNEQLDVLIKSQKKEELTYNKYNLQGFDHDKNRILLGKGQEVWEAAQKAMSEWAMFPDGWVHIYYQNKKFTEGAVVILCARVWGVWWLNAARILVVANEANRFGFTYGTLPNHVETGEECFEITINEQGEVYYSIAAFSRPRYWLARWAYPVARIYQKKFIKYSLQKMKIETDMQLKTIQNVNN